METGVYAVVRGYYSPELTLGQLGQHLQRCSGYARLLLLSKVRWCLGNESLGVRVTVELRERHCVARAMRNAGFNVELHTGDHP